MAAAQNGRLQFHGFGAAFDRGIGMQAALLRVRA